MPQNQKHRPQEQTPEPSGDGPKDPGISRPDTKSLLERMRKVDPDQAKRYRQRQGE